ncbi:MAG TPA: c-type cytochrome [Usitatibacter sp.]|jgi:cytochrome c
MKKTLILAAAIALAPVAVLADEAPAGEALAQKNGCLACHAVDKKIVGPSYKEVATKYRADKDAQAKLEKKVKQGGQGVWGAIPMPPNGAASDADIKSLVKWILSLK